MMEWQTSNVQQRCAGIFQEYQGLSGCLLMDMMQKTLHGMHIVEKVMDCCDIQLILRNGRQSIVCIQILGPRQET